MEVVLCFSIMSISSIASGAGESGLFTKIYNYIQPPDTDEFFHGGHNPQ